MSPDYSLQTRHKMRIRFGISSSFSTNDFKLCQICYSHKTFHQRSPMTLLKFTDRHKKWTRFDISDFRDATEEITWASSIWNSFGIV